MKRNILIGLFVIFAANAGWSWEIRPVYLNDFATEIAGSGGKTYWMGNSFSADLSPEQLRWEILSKGSRLADWRAQLPFSQVVDKVGRLGSKDVKEAESRISEIFSKAPQESYKDPHTGIWTLNRKAPTQAELVFVEKALYTDTKLITTVDFSAWQKQPDKWKVGYIRQAAVNPTSLVSTSIEWREGFMTDKSYLYIEEKLAKIVTEGAKDPHKNLGIRADLNGIINISKLQKVRYLNMALAGLKELSFRVAR